MKILFIATKNLALVSWIAQLLGGLKKLSKNHFYSLREKKMIPRSKTTTDELEDTLNESSSQVFKCDQCEKYYTTGVVRRQHIFNSHIPLAPIENQGGNVTLVERLYFKLN